VVITIFFLFGIVIGSFLNVCITRIPENLSIVRPGSHCPRCKAPIKPYDNLPILSWILLRGKCRACALPISPMYPSVELLTGLIFVTSYLGYGVTQETFKWLFFSCLIIVLTITDLRVRMIPDAVTWPGFGAGLVFSAFLPPDDGVALLLFWKLPHWAHRDFLLGLLSACLGAAFGSLFLWGAGAFYKFLRGRDGLGLGDVKMMAMAGTFMGLRATFLTILVGTFLGSVIGLSVVTALYAGGWKRRLAERASRKGLGGVRSLRLAIASQYQLPLGTFLGIAALLIVQAAPILSRWGPFII
jgi:leader peptidase (prepilin peptidase) / N-methyltransferase